MKISTEKVISLQEWDRVVCETYGKPYKFQQQDGCQDRGVFRFTVPDEAHDDDMHDSIREVEYPGAMGVKFAVWLARDPKTQVGKDVERWMIDMWWERNFYPDFQTVANDLLTKGILKSGNYIIEIDW